MTSNGRKMPKGEFAKRLAKLKKDAAAAAEASVAAAMKEMQATRNAKKPAAPPPAAHPVCRRCGLTNHAVKDCRHASTTCGCCGKIGHTKKVCRSQGPLTQGTTQTKQAKASTANPNTTGPLAQGGSDSSMKTWTCFACKTLNASSANKCTMKDCKGHKLPGQLPAKDQ